eukprot:6191186-Pleurochrysis_carterae.AAC.1
MHDCCFGWKVRRWPFAIEDYQSDYRVHKSTAKTVHRADAWKNHPFNLRAMNDEGASRMLDKKGRRFTLREFMEEFVFT